MKAFTVDRKIGYCTALIALAVSILPFFVPNDYILWATLTAFAIAAAGTLSFIKKRCILSYNKGQVLLIVATVAALYITLFYLSGFEFGFARAPLGVLSVKSFLTKIIPISLIIAGSEFTRHILLAEKDWFVSIIAYFIGVASMLACLGGIPSFQTLYGFADFFGMTLFPALTANILFNYLSRRYGILPNLVYRLILTLYTYIIPFAPATPAIITSFAIMVLPIIALYFIAALFEKKNVRAKSKNGVGQIIVTAILGVVMITSVMLISCQFRFGIIVIATESMTGEINKGDAVVYETREHIGEIKEGDIIIFEKNNKRLVHRVVEINTINGERQYITKGDANEGNDSGYRTDSEIIGIVRFKVLYIGLPTVWLRDALTTG